MSLPEPDIQVYYDELDSFLTRFREEIQIHSQNFKSAQLDQDDLDAYLADLNTYYYQSFHERFFPLYKSKMEADINSLYRISREESALKRDIIRNLKRMAHIYNRIKSAARILAINRDSVSNLLDNSARGREQRIVELLYTLKDLDKSLLIFRNMLKQWQSFLKDRELINSLTEYPFHAALHNLLLTWEADNPKFIKAVKRLMINLQLAAKLLNKLEYSEDPCLTGRNSILDELQKLDFSLASKKSSPILGSWYKQHIQSQFQIYLDLLGLYAEKNERKRCLQTAQSFKKWLQSLLYLLEKSTLSPHELGPLFLDLQSLALMTSELDETSDLCNRTTRSIQQLIKDLADSTNPEFEYYSTASRNIIVEASPRFKIILEQEKIPSGTVLANGLSRLSMQIYLLDMQLDLLNDKEEHSSRLRQQYQQMLHNMDSYLQLLLETQNELARALAPRNISRTFKDMDLKLERIPVNQGEAFPSRYLGLLPDLPAIDIEANDQDYIVAEEDGDIFILKLDEFHEEVIPHIVLSRKG